MPDYKKMYFSLFNAMHQADTILRDALRETSTMYMEEDSSSTSQETLKKIFPENEDNQ